MHTKAMKDSEGVFDEWKPSDRPCPKCKSLTIQYRIWESSCGGYEDLNFKCSNCYHSWWVDGCDS